MSDSDPTPSLVVTLWIFPVTLILALHAVNFVAGYLNRYSVVYTAREVSDSHPEI